MTRRWMCTFLLLLVFTKGGLIITPQDHRCRPWLKGTSSRVIHPLSRVWSPNKCTDLTVHFIYIHWHYFWLFERQFNTWLLLSDCCVKYQGLSERPIKSVIIKTRVSWVHDPNALGYQLSSRSRVFSIASQCQGWSDLALSQKLTACAHSSNQSVNKPIEYLEHQNAADTVLASELQGLVSNECACGCSVCVLLSWSICVSNSQIYHSPWINKNQPASEVLFWITPL